MPEISRHTRTARPITRILRRTAFGAAALVAVGGIIVTASVSQRAMADELDRQVTTAEITETASVHSEQLDVYTGVLAARTAYDEKLAADRAAYLLTPQGAQETARTLAASQYGWGEDQFGCLVNLWQRESGWSAAALNASSGAAGIPQALPGEKMASVDADWQTNPATQIAWGLGYIASAYGTPCAAWGHSESVNWY